MINLDKIIAVSTQSSLFSLVASRSNGLILEDLSNKKQNFFSSRIYQFSPLESIGIYTLTDTIPLKEVYEIFISKNETNPIPLHNIPDPEIKSYFEQVLPQYDPYKVHVKDMKKCIKWYHQLNQLGYFNEVKE